MKGIFTAKDKSNSVDRFFYYLFFKVIEVFMKEKKRNRSEMDDYFLDCLIKM